MRQLQVLIVTNDINQAFIKRLRNALGKNVRIDTSPTCGETLDTHDIVIIDAGGTADWQKMVEQLRESNSGLRILVATASPTWRRAVEAFHSGADDYQAFKHMSVDELGRYFKELDVWRRIP